MNYIKELLKDQNLKKHWHHKIVMGLPEVRAKDLSFATFENILSETFLTLEEENARHTIIPFSEFHNVFSVKLTCELGFSYESFISEAEFLNALKDFSN